MLTTMVRFHFSKFDYGNSEFYLAFSSNPKTERFVSTNQNKIDWELISHNKKTTRTFCAVYWITRRINAMSSPRNKRHQISFHNHPLLTLQHKDRNRHDEFPSKNHCSSLQNATQVHGIFFFFVDKNSFLHRVDQFSEPECHEPPDR